MFRAEGITQRKESRGTIGAPRKYEGLRTAGEKGTEERAGGGASAEVREAG